MRFLLLPAVLLIVASCNKNRSVAKKLEGRWHLYKILKDDGQVFDLDETYEFAKGATDGKTYALWTRYTNTDTIVGSYVVSEKGAKLILRVENTTPLISDTANMEDMDKKTLIFRTKAGVHYFDKEN
jgi:hypothetical protein